MAVSKEMKIKRIENGEENHKQRNKRGGNNGICAATANSNDSGILAASMA